MNRILSLRPKLGLIYLLIISMQTSIINCGEEGQNKKRRTGDIGLADGARAGAGSGNASAISGSSWAGAGSGATGAGRASGAGVTNSFQAPIATHLAMPSWPGRAAAVGGTGYFPGAGGADANRFQAFVRPPTMQYWPFSYLAATAGWPGHSAGWPGHSAGWHRSIHASEFLPGAGAGGAGGADDGIMLLARLVTPDKIEPSAPDAGVRAAEAGADAGGARAGARARARARTGAGAGAGAGGAGSGARNKRTLFDNSKGALTCFLKKNFSLEPLNTNGKTNKYSCNLKPCQGYEINAGALSAGRHLTSCHGDIYKQISEKDPSFDEHYKDLLAKKKKGVA